MNDLPFLTESNTLHRLLFPKIGRLIPDLVEKALIGGVIGRI